MEPAEKFVKKHCLLVAMGLVTPREGKVPLRMFNPTSEVKRIYGGTVAATMQKISAVYILSEQDQGQEHMVSTRTKGDIVLKDVPEHVVDLLDTNNEQLDQDQEKQLVQM